MERIPKQGEFYRHFKNKLYQVITVAKHTETGELLVVYQALYGDFSTYARPLSMFVSEVDHEKYPEAEQFYRFEQETPGREPEAAYEPVLKETPLELGVNPQLMVFLEADTYGEKLEALRTMRGNLGQAELDSICEVLDLPGGSGSLDTQFNKLLEYLQMQSRFDGRRLR